PSDNRREDVNGLLAQPNLPSQSLPALVSGNLRCLGLLHEDQKLIGKAVVMKAGHDAQILLEGITLTGFEGFSQQDDGLLAQFLALALSLSPDRAGRFSCGLLRNRNAGRARLDGRIG